MFNTADDFNRWTARAPQADEQVFQQACALQGQLTKPPGALGRLEDVACWLASWQGRLRPRVQAVDVTVFAGNHGVTARGVSPFPAEVTRQMVLNFEAGGAAINTLASVFGYRLSVVPIELERPTADFSRDAAMSAADCLAALNMGAAAVRAEADLAVFGEMGIGNTTTASALAAAVLGGSGGDWAGRGTGHDDAGVQLKARVIDEALALHEAHLDTPFEILRRLGGREIAAMAGAIIAARMRHVPVVLDGFVVTAAAALTAMSGQGGLDHCLAGHVSAEQAHRTMLERLELVPLLDLGMRLGEGTGAALAVQVVRAAAATHGGMATFAEAGVSDREA